MRVPAFSLAELELRRFFRSPLTRLALVALMVLPLLYAGLYLWSFWDPYGKISKLPVALVLDDRPATVNGTTVNAGRQLTDQLVKRKVFDWHRVDDATARGGVESGRYYMSLTIPANFSANIASPSDQEDPPRAAALQVHLNDANSYIASTLASAAFKEVAAAASGDAVKSYFGNIFVSFGKLHDQLDKAADGANELAAGLDRLEDGAGQLRQGLGSARSGTSQLDNGLGAARKGAGTLTAGLGTAKQGADKLVAGLAKLNTGAGKLQSGGAQVAAGTQQLATKTNQVTAKLLPFLREHPQEIQTAALLVAKGAEAVADELDALPRQTAQAVADARAARKAICAYAETRPEAEPACAAAKRVEQTAKDVDTLVKKHAKDLRKVAADARKLAADARRLAADAPHLADKVQQLRDQINKLNRGAHQLASGIATLHKGIGTAYRGEVQLSHGIGRLQGGSRQLSAGLVKLQAGAQQLSAGLDKLYDGASQLESGLGDASKGARKLASGLEDGVNQVPDWDKSERAQRAGVMSDPVRLASRTSNKAPDYGTGFAPFFIPLALWVGAMFVYMVLRPLNPRALAAAAPAWRAMLSGLLPAAIIGIAQVLVLLGTLRFALGLTAERGLALIGFLMFSAVAFMAVIQWIYARFDAPGRVIALVLLMLQLTSAAGTYPIETSPRFFQLLQPLLPMGWMVKALRHLISGGSLTTVWQAVAVLAGYLLAGAGLTVFTAYRYRVWTVKRLHPVLKL